MAYWNGPFKEIQSCLKLINLYPERLKLVSLGNLLQHTQLIESQKEWICLYNKLHPIEKGYFQPFFVPVNSDTYRIFIDLSQPGFPLYEPIYDWDKHEWYHLTRFEEISELIDFLESENHNPPEIDKNLIRKLDELLLNKIVKGNYLK